MRYHIRGKKWKVKKTKAGKFIFQTIQEILDYNDFKYSLEEGIWKTLHLFCKSVPDKYIYEAAYTLKRIGMGMGLFNKLSTLNKAAVYFLIKLILVNFCVYAAYSSDDGIESITFRDIKPSKPQAMLITASKIIDSLMAMGRMYRSPEKCFGTTQLFVEFTSEVLEMRSGRSFLASTALRDVVKILPPGYGPQSDWETLAGNIVSAYIEQKSTREGCFTNMIYAAKFLQTFYGLKLNDSEVPSTPGEIVKKFLKDHDSEDLIPALPVFIGGPPIAVIPYAWAGELSYKMKVLKQTPLGRKLLNLLTKTQYDQETGEIMKNYWVWKIRNDIDKNNIRLGPGKKRKTTVEAREHQVLKKRLIDTTDEKFPDAAIAPNFFIINPLDIDTL